MRGLTGDERFILECFATGDIDRLVDAERYGPIVHALADRGLIAVNAANESAITPAGRDAPDCDRAARSGWNPGSR